MVHTNSAINPPSQAFPFEDQGVTVLDQRVFRWYWLVLFWLGSALVIASHRPSSLLHPQFWAEDGTVWYAQAYQQGPLLPLAHMQDGYYQVLPRLIADVALLSPLHLAPFLMNVLALLLQGLPVVFLLSRRGEAWGRWRTRAAMALLYLCLPNSWEWHANATNTQWVLAMLALMVLLAELPQSWIGRAVDLFLLTLCGLTGPFCILLAPVAASMAWFRRERWRTVYAALVVALSLLQAHIIFITRHTTRAQQPLGASFHLLTRILAVRIFVGSVLGTLHPLASLAVPWILPLFIVAAALALMGIGLRRAPLELWLFTFFGGEVLAAALRSPQVTSIGPQWLGILGTGASRYYLFPMLAFLLCIGRVAVAGEWRWARLTCIGILCCVPLGVVHNWRDFPRGREFCCYSDFQAGARRFESAPRGTTVAIPIEPGQLWSMSLTKH